MVIADALVFAIRLEVVRVFGIREVDQSAMRSCPDTAVFILDELVDGIGWEWRLVAQMSHELLVPVENEDASCQGAYPHLSVVILQDGEWY